MSSQFLKVLQDQVTKTFTRSFVHQLLVSALISLAVFSSGHALASQGTPSPVDATPVVSSGVLAWGSVTALFCTFLMGITSPGTPTPWNWNPQVRFFVALGAATLSGAVHSLQTGVTAQTAIVTSVGALLAAVLAHFSTPGAMQKVGALLLCGALAASQGACASFDQLVAKSPAVLVSGFEDAAAVVNEGAEVLFPIVVAQLPASQQATAEADFAKAEATYQSALTALNASLAAYQAEDSTTPNWSALIADATTAIDAVISIIDQYGGTVPTLGSAKVVLLNPTYVQGRAHLTPPLAVVHSYKRRP